MRVSNIQDIPETVFGRTRYMVLPAAAAELLEANVPEEITSAAGVPRALAFDDTTEEFCSLSFPLPGNYIGDPVLVTHYRAPSGGATSGVFGVTIAVQAMSDGVDTLADSYDTDNDDSQTVPGTAGFKSSIATELANIDSVAVGDWVVVLFSRDVAVGSNATGDIEVLGWEFQFTGY